MAINTLKGVDEIDGHKVFDVSNEVNTMENYGSEESFICDNPILLDHADDIIAFKMMTKPASEGGSGCQLTTLIETALIMLEYLNEKFPCNENTATITKLKEALACQRHRTLSREMRGVEGFNKA